MGRPPRSFVPGGIYHVFSRGSNRQPIFEDDFDRRDWMNCLTRVARPHQVHCLGYCLMPNHYHLVLQSLTGRLSAAMQALNGRYAQRFNRRHNRDAHLFKNRFGAVLQETDEQLLWTLAYVVRNPVRTGLCAAPEAWGWSSYRATIGAAAPPQFLAVEQVLAFFGDTRDVARARYQELVALSSKSSGV